MAYIHVFINYFTMLRIQFMQGIFDMTYKYLHFDHFIVPYI